MSTNSYSDKIPEWIISLDNYYLWLESFEREIFDGILSQVNSIESKYFHSESYQSSLGRIKTKSKDEIFGTLNVTKESRNW